MQKIYYTSRLILASLDPSAASLVLDYLVRNRRDFEKTEPAKEDSFYSVERQEAVLDAEQVLFERGQGARFYIFDKSDPDVIIGNVSFAHIDGPVSTIGYRVDSGYRRQGIAFEALSFLIPTVLKEFRPNLLEADIYPENEASKQLAEKLGMKASGTTSFRGKELSRYVLFNTE